MERTKYTNYLPGAGMVTTRLREAGGKGGGGGGKVGGKVSGGGVRLREW